LKVGAGSNKYLYNGKELQNELGLDWHDYGARMYDAQLGRFFTQDRFADKYFTLSPYSYAANDPINLVDINGDSIWFTIKDNVVTMHVTGKVMNLSSKDTDMDETVSDISKGLASSFSGKITIDGKKYKMNTSIDLQIAESMDDVAASDHLIILADATGEPGTARGAANIGGKTIFADANDFPEKGTLSGLLGWSNTRTVLHEFGHSAGLEHGSGLMRQGGLGTSLSSNQLQSIYDGRRSLNTGNNYQTDFLGRKRPDINLQYLDGKGRVHRGTINNVGLSLRLDKLK
jgi:RHS repeat-associated protein